MVKWTTTIVAILCMCIATSNNCIWLWDQNKRTSPEGGKWCVSQNSVAMPHSAYIVSLSTYTVGPRDLHSIVCILHFSSASKYPNVFQMELLTMQLEWNVYCSVVARFSSRSKILFWKKLFYTTIEKFNLISYNKLHHSSNPNIFNGFFFSVCFRFVDCRAVSE